MIPYARALVIWCLEKQKTAPFALSTFFTNCFNLKKKKKVMKWSYVIGIRPSLLLERWFSFWAVQNARKYKRIGLSFFFKKSSHFLLQSLGLLNVFLVDFAPAIVMPYFVQYDTKTPKIKDFGLNVVPDSCIDGVISPFFISVPRRFIDGVDESRCKSMRLRGNVSTKKKESLRCNVMIWEGYTIR